MVFRDLTANEIDVRIGQTNERGITLLLYKDARCDMSILDETVGPASWQREHYECKGNLFCRVGIKCTDEWIWKSDCGTESNTEKEKGEASDSFKRACVNWGIGRELYTAPFIYVPKESNGSPNYKAQDRNGKVSTRDKFIVQKIAIKDKKIVGLAICNATLKKTVFVWTP